MTARRADKRQPWRKWYTSAWRSDAPLRMCSYAARGLWVDILTLMHESPTCGFLLVNNVAPSIKQLTGLLGGTQREVRDLLAELGDAGVYSVTGGPMPDDVKKLIPSQMAAGILFSRRMVRDEAKAARDRANGSLAVQEIDIGVRVYFHFGSIVRERQGAPLAPAWEGHTFIDPATNSTPSSRRLSGECTPLP